MAATFDRGHVNGRPRKCRNSATLLYECISWPRLTVLPAPAHQQQSAMASVDATAFDNTIAESRRWPMRRVLAAFVVALALISSFLTFAVLTGLTPIVPGDEVVGTVSADQQQRHSAPDRHHPRRVLADGSGPAAGRAAARLHVQIVALFSAIAMVPAILVASSPTSPSTAASTGCFRRRTRAASRTRWIIANGYINEHAQLISGDVARPGQRSCPRSAVVRPGSLPASLTCCGSSANASQSAGADDHRRQCPDRGGDRPARCDQRRFATSRGRKTLSTSRKTSRRSCVFATKELCRRRPAPARLRQPVPDYVAQSLDPIAVAQRAADAAECRPTTTTTRQRGLASRRRSR